MEIDPDDLQCSVCLGKSKLSFCSCKLFNFLIDIFEPPVRTTLCGHNYCEKCLVEVSNGQQNWSCPESRRNHDCDVKSLPRNYQIEKMVVKMKTQLSKPKPNPRPSKLKKSFKFKAKSQFGVCKEHNREIELRKLSIQ